MGRAKRIIAGLKAGAKALVTPEPQVFRSASKIVTCGHCGGHRFLKRRTSMNTAGSSLMQAEWLDKQACALVCARCTRIEWYDKDLEGTDE
jgi:DNA-directed RNA polymerase subunit RPC12/RpoP